ncbi:MAG TPA: ATP-binding protein, partial [Acidimicrobiia bacterium]|nr:ATP-binding protein [Acidimicrobiia bacterium]
ALADALLLREATACRASRNGDVDPLAGLRIDDATAGRTIADLAGDGGEAAEARAAFTVAVDQAREAFRASLAEPSPFSLVADAAGLDQAEAEVFALLCAVDLDPRRQRLVAYVNDDVTRRRPTLHTISRLFGADHPGPLVVSADSRLRRAALVDVADDGPWADRAVLVHPTVIWALVGDGSGDPDLPAATTTAAASEGDGEGEGASLVVVSGDDRIRRLQAAVWATAASTFLVVPTPSDAAAWAAVVREATLGRLGVVVEVDDELGAEGRRVIERADHLAWAVVSRHELPVDQLPRRPWVAHAAGAERPSDLEWAAALGPDTPRRHPLSAEQLSLVATAYPAVGGDIDAAVRRLAAGRIDRLARRVRPERTWDDLVLPPDQLAQLKELAARYRNRATVYGGWGFRPAPSAGVVALFAGPSGTGKTLAAEILAGDLALELYKLDLAAVVSKYIGETEKNLDQVFDAAAAGNVVLFFDEADALFGKRTEVSDAHDRYANLETAYLLQRLESYDGVVVMATNLSKNIDTAFLRRLHAMVEFPVPEEAERRRLWQRNLMPGAPVKDVDLKFLARQFTITGGSIRNVALTAAFLAAEAGTPITMTTLVLGLQREFQKLGRLVPATDFGSYSDLVGAQS